MGLRVGTLYVACVAALFVVSAHGTFDIIEKGIQQVLCDIPGKVITSATPSVWPSQLPHRVSALCGCNLGFLHKHMPPPSLLYECVRDDVSARPGSHRQVYDCMYELCSACPQQHCSQLFCR